jgi:hypothetical protein
MSSRYERSIKCSSIYRKAIETEKKSPKTHQNQSSVKSKMNEGDVPESQEEAGEPKSENRCTTELTPRTHTAECLAEREGRDSSLQFVGK